jgi:Rrf2 family protein
MRVLMFAGSKGEALATISEIVACFDISRGHVMKVVKVLSRKGYLKTIRGNRGGIRLPRKPAQINISAVVRSYAIWRRHSTSSARPGAATCEAAAEARGACCQSGWVDGDFPGVYVDRAEEAVTAKYVLIRLINPRCAGRPAATVGPNPISASSRS